MANNNRLVLGAIGCLFLTGFAGLSCMGLGGIGWYLHSRPDVADVAAAPVQAPALLVDLLSDAAFLDVSAGPFVAPVAVEETVASEPVPEVKPPFVRRRTSVEAKPETAPPETPPPAEDEEPVISDEDVKALDAEVQEIQEANEAAAPTESKKKKKR